MKYDVIIVGVGPAGISAALYLKRFNYQVLLIGKNQSTLLSENIMVENYYGLGETLSGYDIHQNGIKQAKSIGVDVKLESVFDIQESNDGFSVKTESDQYQSNYVVLATGRKKRKLFIDGFRKFEDKNISYCATCDGFFYRRRKIAILGNDAYMQNEYDILKNLTDELYVLTHGNENLTSINKHVYTQKIKALSGDEKLTQIVLDDDSTIDVDALFIALGEPSTDEFIKRLGLISEKGFVVVDDTYQTNIPNMYAGGDMIGGIMQIAKAVYDGMQIAYHIHTKIKSSKKDAN